MNEEITLSQQQYEYGVDYKTRINLYRTVDLNERFFAGDHWVGIPHEGLPTPVLNMIRRACTWKIAAVADRRSTMNFSVLGKSDTEKEAVARQINDYSKILWERLKMDYLTKESLQDAAITGDGIFYFYWDETIETGQDYGGDIGVQLIDNVNFYPGNPNCANIQKQPYIILVFRDHIKSIKEEARKNGASEEEIALITGDADTEYTAGDLGKVELDDNTKCNVFLKFTRDRYEWEEPKKDENGNPLYDAEGQPITETKSEMRIFAEKSTRSVTVRKKWDTKLKRYPVAMMNWMLRKNSIHGVSEVTGLIPNQVFVNKMLAMLQLAQLSLSMPKVVYDRTRIEDYNNNPAKAIAVNGGVDGAIDVINGATASFDAHRMIETVIGKTMEMIGANDVALGNIQPDNTSAFIATRDAAMVPLQSIQERFYGMLEDIGLIWLDFMRGFYTGREIPIDVDGETMYVPMPDISNMAMTIKIDVGPSNMWSEVQTTQTMNALLQAGLIDLVDFIDGVPKGSIPNADGLKKKYQPLMELRQAAQEAQSALQQQQAVIESAMLQAQVPQQQAI